ncbi:MAG: ABC transporter substrate-binding protein [Kangiellaceae bacterium]|jgi:maltose-binding protein MalE|nr:ABC transporter substrate-binding protein [Kangiellaceae bacterium]|tara:strand:+ start:1451 stop:2626 length:1176 start_codon:yes stop_codon:yes gene_type:complete
MKVFGFLALFVISLLLPAWAADDEPLTVVFTHENKAFAKIIRSFYDFSGEKIKAQWIDQADLKVKLIEQTELGGTPDVVLVPADHLGLYSMIKYSQIPEKLIHKDIEKRYLQTVKIDGMYYGIPVIMGNHLLLYYNKALVSKPASSWKELLETQPQFTKQGYNTIDWSFAEMYWFAPFLGAYGGWPITDSKITLDTPAMEQALAFYWGLANKGLIDPDCNYDCAFNNFINRKTAYVINGIWSYSQFLDVHGDDLGVALLPSIEGKPLTPMFSTHAIAFPNDSLNGAKRQSILKFIEFMQSDLVQKEIWKEINEFPVNSKVLEEIRANVDTNVKVLLEQLMKAQAMPSDTSMAYAWPAMSKGFSRYGSGTLSAKEAAELMQHLAENSSNNAK